MAITYELWAECKDEASLEKLLSHFTGLRYTLLNGREIEFSAEIYSPYKEATGLSVRSKQLSPFGIRSLNDALETTEAGIFLYHRLKSAPAFRFARIDWEAAIITTVELPDFFESLPDGKIRTDLYCVVDDELYKQLGSPVFFYKFREEYWWRKYPGESYEPLSSTDQKELSELCQQLLPDNFSY